MPRSTDAVRRGGRTGWILAALACLTVGILQADRIPENGPGTFSAPVTEVPATAEAPAPALNVSPMATALGRVLGDFDLDATADLSIYHPASGLWFVRRSSDAATFSLGFGGPTYAPVAGDYDGDERADLR